jgi:hypothetical protein
MQRTALHLAVLAGDFARVQGVLSGPPVGLDKRDLVSFFFWLLPAQAALPQTAVRPFLFSLNMFPLVFSQLGATALYTAAKLGFSDILDVLIEAGASISVKDKARSAVLFACHQCMPCPSCLLRVIATGRPNCACLSGCQWS